MSSVLFSPHFDDIAYSLTGYLLSNSQKEFTIVTCFSRSNYCPGLPADSIEEISNIRLREEQGFAKEVDCSLMVLHFQEALLRGFTMESMFESSIQETDLLLELQEEINKIICNKDYSVIFCPLGIGNHIDHMLVKSAVMNSVKGLQDVQVIFFEDLPYCGFMTDDEYSDFMEKMKPDFDFMHTDLGAWVDRKRELLKVYRSQVVADDLGRVRLHTNRIKGERYWYKK